jgi:hypothetical protein
MSMEEPDRPSETEFCPSADDIFLAFMKLLPRGKAWQTRELSSLERDTILQKFFYGVANYWATHLEDLLCRTLDEWFCFSSVMDKDMWEADYSLPDACDLYNADVCSKVSSRPSTSVDSILDLLTKNGYAADARWLKGTDVDYPGVWSTLVVTVDPHISPAYLLSTAIPFPLDDTRALGAPGPGQVQCMLEGHLPLECAVIVNVLP